MRSARKRKIIWIFSAAVVLSVATALVLYALRQNISLYMTPVEVMKRHPKTTQHFRLGGVVVKHSVKHRDDSLYVSFVLTDFQQRLRVNYTGILPALFREGQGIIAEGHLDSNGAFVANTVLAKHDADYHPPNIPTDKVVA